MISIDLGNKYTTITDNINTLTQLSTILLTHHDCVKIGVPKQQQKVIYDFVRVLGLKFNDQKFCESMKFYAHDFQRSVYNTIEIVIPSYQNMFKRRLSIQCLVAIYLKGLINKFQQLYYPNKNIIESCRFHMIILGGCTHSHRYSIKQICQLLRIQNPIFNISTHGAITTFYAKQNQKILKNRTILCIEMSDRSTVLSVYKLHGWQQKIISTLKIRFIEIGGIQFTEILADFILESMKKQKGIDLQKYGFYMNILFQQCEKCKVSLSNQEQYYIRIPNLPDQSTYGKVINTALIRELYRQKMDEIFLAIKETLSQFPHIKQLLLMGAAIQMLEFKVRLQSLQLGMKISLGNRNWSVVGPHQQKNNDITLFDKSAFTYNVKGEENFYNQFLKIDDDIPMRTFIQTKFPSGQLEFNLRVYENGVKVAHFLLDIRPKQSTFKLYFQYNRNYLVEIYVVTSKGKTTLIPNFETLGDKQIINQIQIMQKYSFM